MKVCILGRHGLIGSALEKAFKARGWEIVSTPTPDVKMIFHFASPTHLPFEDNADYHINSLLTDFMYLLPFCRANDIYFIYPSSALVYEKDTQFAKTKKILELYASMYPNTLGLRIFPTYGPAEHRTAIAQWCKSMSNFQQPEIYGDGTQERDFIFVDDVVTQIIDLVAVHATGVADVGAGQPVSFNKIVETINKVLRTTIEPKYIAAPQNYSKGIVCQNPGVINYNIEAGIRRMLADHV